MNGDQRADVEVVSTVERRQRRTIGQQIRVILPIFVVWTVGFLLLIFVGTRSAGTSSAMLLDPTFTPGLSWYTGLVSNLGILAWTVAVVAAFAGAWLCRLGARKQAEQFLFHGALVALVLLLDDLFQLHAIAIPSALGVEKIVPVVMIGVALLAWAVRHRQEILRTHIHLLGAAAIGMGLSFAIDSIVGPAPGESGLIFEDGAKFLGALAWATYFVLTTRDICRSVFTDALMVWPDQVYAELYGELESQDPTPVPTLPDAASLESLVPVPELPLAASEGNDPVEAVEAAETPA